VDGSARKASDIDYPASQSAGGSRTPLRGGASSCCWSGSRARRRSRRNAPSWPRAPHGLSRRRSAAPISAGPARGHQHAPGCRGVDSPGQRHQADAALLEVLRRRDQLFGRAGKPVESPHHQHVAPAQQVMEDAREFGPVRLRAGCLLGERLLAASPPERIELELDHGDDPGQNLTQEYGERFRRAGRSGRVASRRWWNRVVA